MPLQFGVRGKLPTAWRRVAVQCSEPLLPYSTRPLSLSPNPSLSLSLSRNPSHSPASIPAATTDVRRCPTASDSNANGPPRSTSMQHLSGDRSQNRSSLYRRHITSSSYPCRRVLIAQQYS
ncbi:hypothetical protein BJV77DRAFT_534244 [Russula vinacea]|nr:hypothetical protein BJV77DRAFT_534244 [Russula vinacea]